MTSCDDVANGVITRNGYSGSDFTVTCADGQTGSHQCHNGHWSPPRPVCNPVITNPGMLTINIIYLYLGDNCTYLYLVTGVKVTNRVFSTERGCYSRLKGGSKIYVHFY